MSAIYVISTFILLFASLSLASPPPSSRIVNGVLVEPGEFPYVVSLQLNDKHICGGLIYNDLFVLTAASCVQNVVDVADLFVNVADLNFLDDEEVDQEAYSVLNIVVAPEDDGISGQDDLAVIQLTRPLIFGPNVNCIKVGEVEPTGSPKGIIIGYGATASGGLPSNRCRKGDVTMAGSCPSTYWPNYLESYMICAGTADDVEKPCDFDYGSPLVQDGLAVGILSQQNNCQSSSPYDSSIYTRLASYFYWIREEANTQPSNCFKPTVTTGSPTTQTPTTQAPTSTSTTQAPTSTPTTQAPTSTTTTQAPTTTSPMPTTPQGGSCPPPATTVATTMSATTSTIQPYVCPPGSGLYPYPGSCTLYYNCNNGYYIIEKCPDGMAFDPKVSNCTDNWCSIPGCSL